MILFSNNMTSFNFKFHYLLKEKGYINYIVSILKLSQRAQMSSLWVPTDLNFVAHF